MTKARGWEAIYESGLADLARWAPEGIEVRRDGEVLEFRRGERVIYAAANRMGARAAREGVTFKQTPYALEV